MLVLAKAVKGHQYFCNPRSAHKVSKAGCEKIKEQLNKTGYRLKEGEIWAEYDVGGLNSELCAHGEKQKFYLYKGEVREQRYFSY